MATYRIPLTAGPQTFLVVLAGVEYRMTFVFRGEAGWCLDLADGSGPPIISGIPVVPRRDLLAEHRHLGLGGALLLMPAGFEAEIGFDDLATSTLYFIEDAPA